MNKEHIDTLGLSLRDNSQEIVIIPKVQRNDFLEIFMSLTVLGVFLIPEYYFTRFVVFEIASNFYAGILGFLMLLTFVGVTSYPLLNVIKKIYGCRIVIEKSSKKVLFKTFFKKRIMGLKDLEDIKIKIEHRGGMVRGNHFYGFCFVGNLKSNYFKVYVPKQIFTSKEHLRERLDLFKTFAKDVTIYEQE